MKEKQKNLYVGHSVRFTKKELRTKWALVVLAVLIAAISSVSIWNAAGLQAAVDRRTRMYVSDVSLQLTDDINYRLEHIITDLEMLEDSLLRIDESNNRDAVKEFLNRKASILGFTSIVAVDLEGNHYCTSPIQGELLSMFGVKKSMKGEKGVSFLNKQSILYTIPIVQDDRVVGVLGGVRNKENMQMLIQPKSFSGQGLTCITNQEGKVIVSPTDLDPFMELDSLFAKEEDDGKLSQDIQQMQKDMLDNKSGILFFTAVDKTDLVLAYNPLDSYGWILLTLVPANIISYETDQYIFQTFCILTGIIVLFVMMLFVIAGMYRSYYRRLEKIAFVDRLTGEANNAAFQLRCQQMLKQLPPNSCTVVLLNVKNFKLINENFGSAQGDNTLRHIMKVLQQNIREGELAARADADNFFLCLEENDPEVIQNRLSDMVESINSFGSEQDPSYLLTVQQGAYTVDNPDLEITIIQDRAKSACRNRAAQQDGVCIFYDAAFTQQMQKEHDLNELFDAALTNGEFQVYLQPKVWIEGGRLAGAEALIRWNNPQRGMIYPSDFVPVFEKNGKICKLDLFVFEQVCRSLHQWIESGKKPFPISVNLSRQHFSDKDFLLKFKAIADRYEIPAGLLELELTESIFLEDQGIEFVKHKIDEMHHFGFGCSLDDFGAGYSSLGLLMEFDVDAIKLDRRFFLNVSSPKTRDVVKSIVDLAKKIGALIVAEGIETQEQLEFLKDVGCKLVQGYLYAKPMPIPDFERDWLNKNAK